MALERFSRAFGTRYSGTIKSVCPINEPLITALFCGDVGLWPPHGRGWRSYMAVLSRVAQAANRSIRALRETMSDVEIVFCDALESSTVNGQTCAENPALLQRIEEDVTLRNHRRFIVLDLIIGRVDLEHPLRNWLVEHGFAEMDLNWFLRNHAEIDVLCLDYYEHSEIPRSQRQILAE